ncbi:Conserved_hypothetical protein [Hexamita inflata]|uniref:Transmembrane protein n=1 Tax=Hexamita inflata TaxID=28002 RepID=A0AA86PS18_9EUKA|nr:Conserved hypothetical protein [Hexamita inflata]
MRHMQYTLEKERQMYLTVINEYAYFYADNYCYKCDYNQNVIEQKPIDFPYSLRSDIENFPIFGHDFPQLFKSHECQGRYFTNVFDTLYEFSEFKVTKRVILPDIDPHQVQNNKCASCMGRLFATNGKQLFEVLITQDFKLQEIQTIGFKFQNLKLHVMNNNLFLRDPHKNQFCKLMLNDQIAALRLDFDYDEILIDNKEIMLFYLDNNVYYLLYFNQEIQVLNYTVNYTIRNQKQQYIITNNGWSINYDIVNEIVAANLKQQEFYKRQQERGVVIIVLVGFINKQLTKIQYNNLFLYTILHEHIGFYQITQINFMNYTLPQYQNYYTICTILVSQNQLTVNSTLQIFVCFQQNFVLLLLLYTIIYMLINEVVICAIDEIIVFYCNIINQLQIRIISQKLHIQRIEPLSVSTQSKANTSRPSNQQYFKYNIRIFIITRKSLKWQIVFNLTK